jgi:hypothetical protein
MPSAVWNHFKKVKDDPQCQICGKIVKNKGSNTSNLMSHLKTNHYMIYSTLQKNIKQASSPRNIVSSTTSTNEGSECSPRKPCQPSIFEAIEKQGTLPSSNKRAKEITDAITHFLAKDSVPFNAVERPGFKRLLRVLEPRYEVPAKSTFSRERVVKLYDATRKRVLGELKDCVKLSKFGIKLNKLQSRKNIGIIGIFFPVSVFVFFQIPQQPTANAHAL